ncbi:MAG TPA: PQQ-binding-like beta-propeller repeat protein [Acidimicrobiia bacterium]|nr:PQQ-binding-like beta-propeller repeat protein [Acidimicrobiia bacterium]
MAKTIHHPRPTEVDDLVPHRPPERRAPESVEMWAVVAAAVALVVALFVVPAAVGGDVELGDGGLTAVEGDLAWAADLGVEAEPILAGHDTVVVGRDPTAVTGTTAVRALHADTGAERWSTDFDGRGAVPLHIGLDTVLVRSANSIAVLDLDTGQVMWDRVYAPDRPDPAVAEGVVLMGGDELMAVELGEGEPLWRRDFPTSQRPTVADTVAFVAAPGAVRAVELEGGTELWAAPLDSPSDLGAPAVVAGDLVVVANRTGDVVAFDRSTGERRWAVFTQTGDPVVSLFTVDSIVIAGGRSGTVSAFTASTGARLWDLATDVDLSDPQAIQSVTGTVVVGGPDSGELVVADLDTGERLWAIDGEVTAPPVATGSTVFAAVEGGFGITPDDLVAFDLATGERQWVEALSHRDTGQILPWDDGILVTSADGQDRPVRLSAFS